MTDQTLPPWQRADPPPPYPLRRANHIRILYHVTPMHNLASILAHGIEPRAGRYRENYWKPSIYFVRRYRDAFRVIEGFHYDMYDTTRYHPSMVIIQVNPRRMGVARFYEDPAYRTSQITSVLTLAEVPPRAIRNIATPGDETCPALRDWLEQQRAA